MYSAFYLKIKNFCGQTFSWNKSLRLADQKTANVLEFLFTMGSFIVNCTGFAFAMDRFERYYYGINMK